MKDFLGVVIVIAFVGACYGLSLLTHPAPPDPTVLVPPPPVPTETAEERVSVVEDEIKYIKNRLDRLEAIEAAGRRK